MPIDHCTREAVTTAFEVLVTFFRLSPVLGKEIAEGAVFARAITLWLVSETIFHVPKKSIMFLHNHTKSGVLQPNDKSTNIAYIDEQHNITDEEW